jgi:phosphoribulokinase
LSSKHPIVAVTGSAGAGTTTVRHAFSDIFRRKGIRAAFVEGDSFFRYERDTMDAMVQEAARDGRSFSHFGPEANLFERLEALFREYAEHGTGDTRHYLKEVEHEATHSQSPGTFTPWAPIPAETDLLFYEGLHGGVAASTWTRRRRPEPDNIPAADRREGRHRGVDVARHVDLLIGVVPIINLEWIQKIHRDCAHTGCEPPVVTATILRRLQDYVHFIVPQFSLTDVNFQRVPLVDTSNPFLAADIPTADESLVVIHFRDPRRFNFPELLRSLEGARMTRPGTLVVPGGDIVPAMEVVCSPLIQELMEQRQENGA